MSKKDKIIELYFEKKMSAVEISKEMNVVPSYITKVIKQDLRYNAEKEHRKNEVTIINKFKDESSINIQEIIEKIFKTFYELKTNKKV